MFWLQIFSAETKIDIHINLIHCINNYNYTKFIVALILFHMINEFNVKDMPCNLEATLAD